MEHTQEYTSHAGTAETYAAAKKEVWKVTGILTAYTLVELALGYYLYLQHSSLSTSFVLFIKGVILILMMVKAFYIVAYFMHLKHEIRNMIMTIVVPLTLFIWFIAAFLMDGNSYKNLRNTYDPHYKESTTQKVEKKAHEGSHGTEGHSKEHK